MKVDKVRAEELLNKLDFDDADDVHDLFMYLAEIFNYNIVDKETGNVVNYYLCSDYKIFEK